MPTLREIVEANVPPHLRDYIYRMVGKEGISGKDSPTGAAGPLQFTKGTGAKYGLVGPRGDIRRDPVANIRAGVTLTMDNAAVLRKGLGREPSASELALAHQQGPETAVKMLTGTGNAPARNLIVNKVDPNLPPQEAAKQIMNYYGFNKTPGMTLTSQGMFDPNAPGAFAAPAEGAVPYAGGFALPTGGTSLTTTPVEAPASINFADRFLGTDAANKLLGADRAGGKGTPFANLTEGLGDLSKGISPKTTDPTLNQITPTSGIGVDQRIAAQQPLAQNILTQMIQSMQARRGMR